MLLSFDTSDINFYFSFQDPYCYLAWVLLQESLKEFNSIKVKPINIGLNPPNNKFSYRESWGGLRWMRLVKEAKLLGITMNKPLQYVSENLTARCIPDYGVGGAEYYITSIFKAEFTNNIDISITHSLRYFLQSEGNDSDVLVNSSNNSKTLDAYKAQIDLWGKKRIRAIPTIEVGNERIAGYIAKKQLDDLLRSLTDKI